MLREGYDLISEVFNFLNNVYGVLYLEIVVCFRLFVRFNYIMGEYGEVKNLRKILLNNLFRLFYIILFYFYGLDFLCFLGYVFLIMCCFNE